MISSFSSLRISRTLISPWTDTTRNVRLLPQMVERPEDKAIQLMVLLIGCNTVRVGRRRGGGGGGGGEGGGGGGGGN